MQGVTVILLLPQPFLSLRQTQQASVQPVVLTSDKMRYPSIWPERKVNHKWLIANNGYLGCSNCS